ncbi:MtaA/CmuA family methyltransferase [Methylorubrum extorquens]|uniref:CmuA n=3 Tax=Pseudomonadota TaxID=1224 RepID=A0A0U2XNV4_ECOLX|nr:MtaA/CmuA family methyltransferase [Methylorubrum extorquens]ACK86415.1 methyltransferase MtaA/CmuA family [Methylorubrum extorquens CM4]ALS39159.1 CmuA [Escherichia coli]CAB39403.1 CmuA protein [Methylorubrum extorquens CM4]
MAAQSGKMTSRERMFAAVTMTDLPDQVPCVPLLMARGIREGGITVDQALRDGEASAHAKAKALEKFGGDVIIAGTDLFTPVECVDGCELDYLPHAQPSLVRHPTPNREAFYRFKEKYEREGFKPSDRVLQIMKEAQTMIKLGYKDTHVIPTPVGGPITTAQLMTGSSEFLSYLSEDPEYALEVTELALDVVKNVCRLMFESGIDVCNILDPFNSSDILPPEVYRKHGLPFQKRLFAYIKEIGGIGFTHTCTFTQPIWRDIAENGCLNFNGDMYPGMEHAKRAIGGQISLMGTLSPFSTLMHGSTTDVANEVKKLAAEVGYNGGFICMPGCDIDWTIPDENLKAMIDTCASIKYPMDIAALGDLSNVYIAGNPKHPGKRSSSVAGDVKVEAGKKHELDTSPEGEVYEKLVEAIMDYDADKAKQWVQVGLDRGISAQKIVFDGLSLGMKIVGDMYERNERFVTDMLKAAKTMDAAMPLLTPLLESSGSDGGPTGTVIVGLVRGNTQDIGKNLVCLMLKANGFKVIDLGKNVKPEQFIETAEREGAVAIGMSVMTNSSTVYVEKVAEMLKSQGKADKYLLMMGGAAANRGVAEKFGVRYGLDANAAVSLVRDHVESRAAA